MTYKEALEANKRSYRNTLRKNCICTNSAGNVLPGIRPDDFATKAADNSKNLAKIFIPPGAVVNLLNIIEISSPGGISLKASLPLFGGHDNDEHCDDAVASLLSKFVNSAGQTGGLISIKKMDDNDKQDDGFRINL